MYIDFGQTKFSYWQFMSDFKNKYKDYEFDVLNLFKIHLLEKVPKDYDNVLGFIMTLYLTPVKLLKSLIWIKYVSTINVNTDVLPLKFQKHIKS